MKHYLKLFAHALWLVPSLAFAQTWSPVLVEEVTPPFSSDGQLKQGEYHALDKASKKWNICVSFPHMKDAYWLAVDYGVVAEARRLGVALNIFEAGGYTELSTQISQIEDCVASGADALVLGAISGDGLNALIKELKSNNIPVIDVINGVSSKEIAAKSLVSFYTMGFETGKYLADRHPSGSKEVKVGWFPGPAGAGWVETANLGFHAAVKNSAVKVLKPRYGDTGKEIQLKLVEDVLQSNPDISYIVGTAPTVEAAQGLIRDRDLRNQISLLSFYLTPGIYEGIKRGFIKASPTDSTVIQARIAVDQAVRILEKKDYIKHVGPKIHVLDPENIDSLVTRDHMLAPNGFKPVFRVD